MKKKTVKAVMITDPKVKHHCIVLHLLNITIKDGTKDGLRQSLYLEHVKFPPTFYKL